MQVVTVQRGKCDVYTSLSYLLHTTMCHYSSSPAAPLPPPPPYALLLPLLPSLPPPPEPGYM